MEDGTPWQLFTWLLARRLRQAACRWRTGHVYLRHFDGKRFALRCADCGRITDGWRVSGRRTDS